ncbi:MAG: hypothetical protein WCT04_08630 [Planctomycetota bacterium]
MSIIRPSRKAFEDEVEPPGRPCFKDALFVFELDTLPEDLKVCKQIVAEFKRTAESQTTFIATAGSIDEAAV